MKARADEIVDRPTTAEGRRLRLLNAATLLVEASNGEANSRFRVAVVNFIALFIDYLGKN